MTDRGLKIEKDLPDKLTNRELIDELGLTPELIDELIEEGLVAVASSSLSKTKNATLLSKSI